MSTKTRRFSHREEKLVDGMIQSIRRNISLAESYDDEARDIGWSAFLSVYGKYPAWFLWTGAGGWARAYLEIQKELLAFKAWINSSYYTVSLDQPLGGESETPRIDLLPTCHGDFAMHVCLQDYLARLPEDEQWLARTLTDGYSVEEIPVIFRCDPGELDELYRRLRESMTRYLAI